MTIISHARRFIFIKTVKTGGSSLELALSKYCADGDVLTPLLPEEEVLRAKLGGVPPQNYGKPLRSYGPNQILRRVLKGEVVRRFAEHSSALDVRRKVGPEVWNSYFKFTIARHPFDRMVSAFFYTRAWEVAHHNLRYYDFDDFDQFIRYHAEFVNQNWRLYTERDQVMVDFVAHYERLEEDLAVVSERIGLDHNLHEDMRTIRAKGEHRPHDRDARQILEPRHKQLISLLCVKEMQLLGYEGSGSLAAA